MDSGFLESIIELNPALVKMIVSYWPYEDLSYHSSHGSCA